MRILTYAVRKAMALGTKEDESQRTKVSYEDLDQNISLASRPKTLNSSTHDHISAAQDPHLIPCSTEKINSIHNNHTTQHPSKRIKLAQNRHHDVQPQEINQAWNFESEDPHQQSDIDHITRDNLPFEMEKYWAQRERLFSKFDQGIKMDKESWYSVTPEAIAKQIAARCRCKVIVDGFCGAGGNTIQFAMTCEKVIAIDKDPNKIKLAKWNSKIYGVEDKIKFICTDFTEWIKSIKPGSVDVIFLSPPWGGMDYLNSRDEKEGAEQDGQLSDENNYYKLNDLEPIDGKDLYHLSKKITHQIAFYLPRHMDLLDLAQLVCSEDPENLERFEVEEDWMNSKCKALTAYFGSLVAPSS